MRHFLIVSMFLASAVCEAQGLLAFRTDLDFDSASVESLAERAYRARVNALAAEEKLDRNLELRARLRHLIDRLRPATLIERPEARTIAWEIHTCRHCGENASAMAGGRLMVGEAFVERLGLTDDELGYLVAHEMGHVLAEHTREYATTARYFVGNGRLRHFEDIQAEIDESYVVNLRMAWLAASQEFEADRIGFVLGARSGFDPAAFLSLLHKLGPGSGSALSLHAGHGERLQRAEAMLEMARRIRERGLSR